MSFLLPNDNSYRAVKNWFLSQVANNPVAEPQEAFRWLVEEGLGYSFSRLLSEEKNFRFSEGDIRFLILSIKRIFEAVPLQYITGHTWFAGLKIRVSPQVLIPRPETEEMVQWLLSREKIPQALPMLDVGTGSGAIALAIKKEAPQACVTAIDISDEALLMARENAQMLGLDINLIRADIMDETFILDPWKIIVSNPPYVPRHEASTLAPPVRLHEPPGALFVPDDDPALFYKALFRKARPGHKMYVEFGPHQQDILETMARNFGANHFERRRDAQGHWRMAYIAF
jgi:release factor glutamine methyltransferase